LDKRKIMTDTTHPPEKLEMVSEPAIEAYPDIAGIKTALTRFIQESEDPALLKEIFNLLQTEKKAEKPLNLSRHIDDIFKQYPETLSKLAQ